MYCGRDYSPQNRIESEVVGLDFINDIEPIETLIASRWDMAVVAGVDPDPNDHLEGPSMVVAPEGSLKKTATIQRVGGLWPGVTYRIRATVVTDQGNTVELWSHIRGIASDV